MQRFCFFLGGLIILCSFACNKKIADVTTNETPPKIRIPLDSINVEPEAELEPLPDLEDQEDIVIELIASIRKTPCYGYCPVFEYKYYSDGRVSYNGQLHVDRIGVYETWVDIEFKSKIESLAQSIKYFSLEEEYPPNGRRIEDLPSTITYLKIDDREKSIKNNYDSPLVLRDFEKELLLLFNSLPMEIVPAKTN